MTRKYLRSVRLMLSRRQALRAMAALAATGCAGDDSGSGSEGGTTGAGTTGPGPTTGSTSSTSGPPSTGTAGEVGSGTTAAETTGDGSTSTSTDTTGALPDECLDTSELSPDELLAGIDHVVVLVMENRSFDHYFGSRKLVENEASNGLSGDESNPNFEGEAVSVYASTQFEPKDPPHGWDSCHFQFNLGDNNGFVLENQKANPGFGYEAMGYISGKSNIIALKPL